MATARGFDDSTVSDELALNFHLMHPGEDSAPGDPNLAYCLDGVYHLHYILRHRWRGGTARPHDRDTSFCFIHVTSPDMLHWTWQTTKLQPSFTGHGTFSGTGFITSEGKPAAMYPGLSDPGRTYITVAEDNRLSGWSKPYPVLPTGVPEGKKVILSGDPDLFQVSDTYYAYSAGDNLELVKSTDLVNWRYVGPLLQHDLPDVALGEDTSCANLYPLGDKWMLLCISHQIGCRYYLGDWDAEAEQFVPQIHERMNWRRADQSLTEPVYRDFFAPESVLTADGRRVMWAWLCTADPAIDLKSVQSLPRELSLHADGTLRIEPLRELETLRYDPLHAARRGGAAARRGSAPPPGNPRMPVPASPSRRATRSRCGSRSTGPTPSATASACCCSPTMTTRGCRCCSGRRPAPSAPAPPRPRSRWPTCRRGKTWNCASSSTSTWWRCSSTAARRC